MGGEAVLAHSSVTRISEKTSSSHPAFIPSIFCGWKPPLTGVGRISALDGGLLWLWGALSLWMLARFVGMVARFRTTRWEVAGAVRPP